MLVVIVGCTNETESDLVETSTLSEPSASTSSPTSSPQTDSPSTTKVQPPPGTDSGSILAMTPPEDDMPVVEPGPAAATELVSTPGCSETEPGRGFVDLAWVSGGPGETRIDFTMFFRGLITGDFVSTPPLPGEQTEYRVYDPEPGIRYEWRVLTELDQVWLASEVGVFQTATCVVDAP